MIEIKPVPEDTRIFILPDLAYEITMGDIELNIMKDYLEGSTGVWVGLADGELACVLGVISRHLVSDQAYLWFLNGPKFDRHRFAFARRSRDIIAALLDHYPILTGHCVRSNPSAIRWLTWLGATFTDANDLAVSFKIRAQ